MEDIDALTGVVVHEAYVLYRQVGPGLLESVYETILAGVLAKRGISAERQKVLGFEYNGIRFSDAVRLDLLVDGRLVVELKSVEKNHPVHSKQVLTYLRVLHQPVGLLINFGAPTFRDAVKRIVNNYEAYRTEPLKPVLDT
jgi:GxxExxY protein